MKRPILLLLVLVCISLAISDSKRGVNDVCTTNADCNNYGVCLSSFGGYFGCSCLTGYGGTNKCNTRPASTCIFSPVYPNVTKFNPSIGISVASAQLSVAVAANLEQNAYANPGVDDTATTDTAYALETRVRFGGSSVCDYPPSLVGKPWTHNAADAVACKDNWGLTLPWANAISDCGFSDGDNDHTWTQTVTVSRKYQLPQLGDGVPITRTESVSKVLRVVFPTSVTVQTDVNVTGPVAVSVNAIVSSSYDPVANLWTVVLKTLTNRPYKLNNPTIANPTGSANRIVNVAVSDVTACNSNDSPCTQNINVYFSGCTALSGGMIIRTTPGCSGTTNGNIGGTCPSITGYVDIGVGINAADSCAIVNNIDFSVKSLYSFSNTGLTTPSTLFAASDIAYFGAVIQSTNATLTGFTLSGVSMCLGATCSPVSYNTISNAGGMSPAFAINLAQTRYFTSSTDRQSFTVKATVSVTWANGKRDVDVQIARANIDSYVSINLAEENDNTDDATSGSSVVQVSFVFACLMFVLSVL